MIQRNLSISQKLIQTPSDLDQRLNCNPLLPVQHTNPVHEPLPVKGRDLEGECNALGIETVVRIGEIGKYR